MKRGIFVAGLREEIVASPEQVLELMEFGECELLYISFCQVLIKIVFKGTLAPLHLHPKMKYTHSAMRWTFFLACQLQLDMLGFCSSGKINVFVLVQLFSVNVTETSDIMHVDLLF